ncbi:MAG: hypothetical protein ABFD50_07865 [Smithella sp.]
MNELQFNPNNHWVKASGFQKRIQGFACYIICAFGSLVYPVETDVVLYKHLKKQFIEQEGK